MTDLATLNPYDPQALGNVALAALTALAQAKGKAIHYLTPLAAMPEAEDARQALKAALEAGCPKDHLRNLMKAAFGGDLAGQANTTVGEAALFPAMEPEMAQASILPDHEEGLERALAKAMQIATTPRPVEKAQVGAYTRTHLGKVIQVHEYQTRRQHSMNATKGAHGASDAALKSRKPEDHQKASAAHLDALRQHTEAHELSPADVAQDHKELMDHHRAAARWHADKAKGATATYGTEKVEAHGPERPAAKAHHDASTRVVNGKVVYIHDYDNRRPWGRAAELHERTTIGKHRSGTHYLRATDAEDGAHIQAAADRLGIKTDKRRAGANHFGRVGAYDHYHVESPEHALAIHAELKKHPVEVEGEPTPKLAEQGQKEHGNASAGGNPPSENEITRGDGKKIKVTVPPNTKRESLGEDKGHAIPKPTSDAENIGQGMGDHFDATKENETKFPKGSNVKDRYGNTHEVIGHNGNMVATTGGEFHSTKVTPHAKPTTMPPVAGKRPDATQELGRHAGETHRRALEQRDRQKGQSNEGNAIRGANDSTRAYESSLKADKNGKHEVAAADHRLAAQSHDAASKWAYDGGYATTGAAHNSIAEEHRAHAKAHDAIAEAAKPKEEHVPAFWQNPHTKDADHLVAQGMTGNAAHQASTRASSATGDAVTSGKKEDHDDARAFHRLAAEEHRIHAKRHAPDSKEAQHMEKIAQAHDKAADWHNERGNTLAKPSDFATPEATDAFYTKKHGEPNPPERKETEAIAAGTHKVEDGKVVPKADKPKILIAPPLPMEHSARKAAQAEKATGYSIPHTYMHQGEKVKTNTRKATKEATLTSQIAESSNSPEHHEMAANAHLIAAEAHGHAPDTKKGGAYYNNHRAAHAHHTDAARYHSDMARKLRESQGKS